MSSNNVQINLTGIDSRFLCEQLLVRPAGTIPPVLTRLTGTYPSYETVAPHLEKMTREERIAILFRCYGWQEGLSRLGMPPSDSELTRIVEWIRSFSGVRGLQLTALRVMQVTFFSLCGSCKRIFQDKDATINHPLQRNFKRTDPVVVIKGLISAFIRTFGALNVYLRTNENRFFSLALKHLSSTKDCLTQAVEHVNGHNDAVEILKNLLSILENLEVCLRERERLFPLLLAPQPIDQTQLMPLKEREEWDRTFFRAFEFCLIHMIGLAEEWGNKAKNKKVQNYFANTQRSLSDSLQSGRDIDSAIHSFIKEMRLKRLSPLQENKEELVSLKTLQGISSHIASLHQSYQQTDRAQCLLYQDISSIMRNTYPEALDFLGFLAVDSLQYSVAFWNSTIIEQQYLLENCSRLKSSLKEILDQKWFGLNSNIITLIDLLHFAFISETLKIKRTCRLTNGQKIFEEATLSFERLLYQMRCKNYSSRCRGDWVRLKNCSKVLLSLEPGIGKTLDAVFKAGDMVMVLESCDQLLHTPVGDDYASHNALEEEFLTVLLRVLLERLESHRAALPSNLECKFALALERFKQCMGNDSTGKVQLTQRIQSFLACAQELICISEEMALGAEAQDLKDLWEGLITQQILSPAAPLLKYLNKISLLEDREPVVRKRKALIRVPKRRIPSSLLPKAPSLPPRSSVRSAVRAAALPALPFVLPKDSIGSLRLLRNAVDCVPAHLFTVTGQAVVEASLESKTFQNMIHALVGLEELVPYYLVHEDSYLYEHGVHLKLAILLEQIAKFALLQEAKLHSTALPEDILKSHDLTILCDNFADTLSDEEKKDIDSIRDMVAIEGRYHDRGEEERILSTERERLFISCVGAALKILTSCDSSWDLNRLHAAPASVSQKLPTMITRELIGKAQTIVGGIQGKIERAFLNELDITAQQSFFVSWRRTGIGRLLPPIQEALAALEQDHFPVYVLEAIHLQLAVLLEHVLLIDASNLDSKKPFSLVENKCYHSSHALTRFAQDLSIDLPYLQDFEWVLKEGYRYKGANPLFDSLRSPSADLTAAATHLISDRVIPILAFLFSRL